MSRRGVALLTAVFLVGALGCRRPEAAPVNAPPAAAATGEVQIASAADTFVLRVEIADTPRRRRAGLSRRADLPEDAGMIFLFGREQPPGSGFWMYRTHIPLSVAYLDARGVIRAIREMEPCESRIPLFCPVYRAGVPYHAALEVNRGYLARRGIGVGDRVTLRRDRRRAAPAGAALRPPGPSPPRGRSGSPGPP